MLDVLFHNLLQYNLLVVLAAVLSLEIIIHTLFLRRKYTHQNFKVIADIKKPFRRFLIAHILFLLYYIVLISFSGLQGLDTFFSQNFVNSKLYAAAFACILLLVPAICFYLKGFSLLKILPMFLLVFGVAYSSTIQTEYTFALYQNFSIMPHIFLNAIHDNFYLAWLLNILLWLPPVSLCAEFLRFLANIINNKIIK